MVAPYLATCLYERSLDVNFGHWAKPPTVLSQDRFPTSKCEEFFQSDGAGLRDVVYGVGAGEAC